MSNIRFEKGFENFRRYRSVKLNKNGVYWFLSIISVKYKNNARIQNFLPKDDYQPTTYNHTFEEFLKLAREKSYNYAFAHWASDVEYKKCIDYLQQTKNEKYIIAILGAFQYENCPKQIPEDLLFSLINVHTKEVDYEIYHTLSYMKSKKVEKLALNLLNDKQNAINAIHMLMVNYKKEYKNLLASAYKKVKFSFYDYTPLLMYTIDFMYTTKKDLPDEILSYAYEKSFDSFNREYIVDCMRKRKLLTKDLIMELQYDSGYNIRKKTTKLLGSI